MVSKFCSQSKHLKSSTDVNRHCTQYNTNIITHCFNIYIEWNKVLNFNIVSLFYKFSETIIIGNDLILVLQMVPAKLLSDLISCICLNYVLKY